MTPNFGLYFNNLKDFRSPRNPFYLQIASSLDEISSKPFKYLVAYIPELLDVSEWMSANDLLIQFETIFRKEVVLLDSVEQLQRPDFASYLQNDCIYLCKDVEQTVNLHTYFDVFIQDTMTLPPELADVDFKDKLVYGKSFIESHILPNIFLSKVADRIQSSSMLSAFVPQLHNRAHFEPDVCLMLGTMPSDFEEALYDVVCDLLEKDKVSCILVCNDQTQCDYNNALDRYEGDTRYVMMYSTDSNTVTQRASNVIWRKMAAINKKTTSVIAIGTFTFADNSVQEHWVQNMKKYAAISLFEPWAWASMNEDHAKPAVCPAQTTLQIKDVLMAWNECPVDIQVQDGPSANTNRDDHDADATDDEDGDNA